MSLNRTLRLPMLIFYGTGMILGAGIYSIIGRAAGIAGAGLWQGFLLAAFTAFLTALSYAELGTMFPKTGGEYIYLRKAFSKNRWPAVAVGIIVSFAGCTSIATVAMAFASYIQYFFALNLALTALGLVLFFSVINIIGIKESSWVNAIFTIIEVCGLILFISLGIKSPEFGNAIFVSPGLATISSAALIIFAYLGFENIVSLAEETIAPEINIPRAIFISLLLSTLLYVLVSLSAVALMPPEQLALTDSALTDAAMKSSKKIAGILGGIALFSTANTVLIGLITTSRILYGIAKDGSLPNVLTKTLTKQKTPWVAALVIFFIVALLLPLGKIKTLASIAAFFIMIAFVSVNIALIRLRYTHPNAQRPFRVPMNIGKIPLPTLIAILTCTIFLFQFEHKVYVIGFLVFLVALTIYFISHFLINKKFSIK